MKISILRGVGNASLLLCVVCWLSAAHSMAQIQTYTTTADTSVVSAAAEAQGLQLVPPGLAPVSGTFWVVMPGSGGFAAPFPTSPLDSSMPIYAITDTQFLVDGTIGSQQAFALQALEAQSNAVVSLISQIQTTAAIQQPRTMMSAMDSGIPMPNGIGDTNGSGTNASPSYNIPTYTLTTDYADYTNFWLTIACSPTNSTVGNVSVVSTLPGLYYAILTNADLNKTGTNWVVWTTLLATSSNTPAPPISLGQTNLNFRGKIILPSSSYITNGLVAYWKMNDAIGTNAADSSGNGVTMPLIGSPSWGPGFLILNGINQYGDAGSNALTSLDQSDKTICAWIYKTNANFCGIVDKSLAGGSFGWGFWDTGTNLVYYAASGVNGFYTDPVNDTVPLNQWVFVALVWMGGDNAAFYTNGVLNESNIVLSAGDTNSSIAHLQVGNMQIDNSGNFKFGGYIRDVAVYNRALSYGEVGANFVNSQYPFSTNIAYPDVLYYKMADYNSSNATSATFPIFDSSIHGGTTGTYSNTSDTWVTNAAGLANTALHFSGDKGYIETSNSTLFNFTSNLYSINFWVNPYGGSNGYVLMQNGISPNNGWNIALNGDNTITFGTETNGLERAFTSIGGCNDNVYTMVTIVRNSSTNASIYLNGFLSTNGIITSPAPSTNSLRIGSDLMGNYVLDGNIWLTQIWSTNLSDSDVARLYWHQFLGKSWP